MDIIKTLLASRGLKTKKAIEGFFRPTHPKDIPSPFDSKPAIRLIKAHIKKGHKIAIYGDYDVDGICSTAILWETLYGDYKNVFPHIPHRESEGYGLSFTGIDHCLSQGASLIIAVDNGIVANEQIDYCRQKKCDIIVIDHHEANGQLPNANYILHATSSCATALSWFFCRDYLKTHNSELLSLVAVATICDIVPLLDANRSFAKFGLEELNKTQRPGLLALFQQSGLYSNDSQLSTLNSYHVGFIIGPRINAMGRLEHAIDSLRLLCTHDLNRAKELAIMLGEANRSRQELTRTSVDHALGQTINNQLTGIMLAADTSYHPGVVGLIAAKMVEKYSRPSLAVSIGDQVSRGSGRSVAGFDLTQFLRKHTKLFGKLGGHAMACGFTLPTTNLPKLAKVLSEAKIDEKLLIKTQRIDAEIPLELVNWDLWFAIQKFQPFGLNNPIPIFKSSKITPKNIKKVGSLGKHIKFTVDNLDCIWFNAQDISKNTGDIVYSIEENVYNGNTNLQLVVKNYG